MTLWDRLGLDKYLDRCCVCNRPYGIVWDLPGYRNQWAHFSCAGMGDRTTDNGVKMNSQTKTNYADKLQEELYQQGLHTCHCGNSFEIWKGGYVPGTTKVVGADLEDPLIPRSESRFVFYTTKCSVCKQQVLHGESCGNYSATGRVLVKAMTEKISVRLECSEDQALRKLRRFFSKYGINYAQLSQGSF